MLVLDGLGLCVRLARLAQAVKPVLGCIHGLALVDDGRWISRGAQFRYPLPDVVPFGVVIARLLGRRIDAQRVDACRARLHLHLAPVDAGLEIEELARQKQPRLAPVQPQVVGRKADQHGAHAEIQPTGGTQLAHAGIDHRIAGAAFAPCLEANSIHRAVVNTIARAQPVDCSRHIAPLDGGFVFKLLHEVTVPAQPAGKAAQGVRQVAIGRAGDARLGGLMHATHRDRAEGQVRAQAAATLGGGERTGHRASVVAAAAAEKAVQHRPRGTLAAQWQGRARIGQTPFAQRGHGRRLQPSHRPEAAGLGCLRCIHAACPSASPTGARTQAPHHARLRRLQPVNTLTAAPLGHSHVARKAPSSASFLVAQQMGECELAAQILQHLRHGAASNQQRQPALRQIGLESCHTVQQEGDVTRVAFRAVEPLRLDDHQTQRVFKAHRLGQRGMVTSAKVALEPDQRRRTRHGVFRMRQGIGLEIGARDTSLQITTRLRLAGAIVLPQPQGRAQQPATAARGTSSGRPTAGRTSSGLRRR